MQSNDEIWARSKSTLRIGETVSCIVTDHCPFGILVRLEREVICGVIERICMNADGFQTPEEYPPIGAKIDAAILGFRDYSQQVELRILPETVSDQVVHSAESSTPSNSAVDSLSDDNDDTLVEVGLRVQANGELTYFGIDQVNQATQQGQTIVRIEKGRAIMVKSAETDQSVKMRLQGFSVIVVMRN